MSHPDCAWKLDALAIITMSG